MNVSLKERLKGIRDAYFGSITDPVEARKIEMMYQAFAARLMLETEIKGGSCEGVVYGHLSPRKW